MSQRFILFSAFLIIMGRAEAGLLAPPTAPNQLVIDATNVLSQSVAMPSGLPQKILASAEGVAIVPNLVRGAFVVGVQRGRGVLLIRGPDRRWQAPRMIEITGGSLGYQVGVQSTDLILVFRTPKSVANVMRGTLKIGVDASAAAGPLGRQASAATDLPLQAEILSYSRARGAFVGASIDGSSISFDNVTDAMYYQPPGTVPASAAQLVQLISTLSAGEASSQRAAATSPGTTLPATAAPSPNSFEATRQELDSASRQLAACLDDQWKKYLALPAEVYIPNLVPNVDAIQEALVRYEIVARQSEYAALTSQPSFQATLNGLRRLGELQQGRQ
ncbi:MAG: lipid-binding SYLF domain-containing protein [Pirellulales bacterium]